MSLKPLSFFLLVCLFVFQGCSGLRPYPKQTLENISITTKVDSGSFFSSVEAEVDIFTLDEKCQSTYEGTLELDSDSITSGISIKKAKKLSFIFSNSSFFGGDSSISFPVHLKAKKGYQYDCVVTYKDNIYNVELFEVHPKTKKRRELNTEKSQVCKVL